jgi:hypothetical protein
MEVVLAPCAECGLDTGGIHKCPGCNSNMHGFCGTGVGDEGYGQKRTCKHCAAKAPATQPAQAAAAMAGAAPAAAVAAAMAGAAPAAAVAVAAVMAGAAPAAAVAAAAGGMFRLQPAAVAPPTKPKNVDVRSQFTFMAGAGGSVGKTVCTCNHCGVVVQTTSTVNATRLKTHAQECQKCPGEVKVLAYNSGQGAKKIAKLGSLLSPSGKSLGEQPLQEVRAMAMAGPCAQVALLP